MNDEISMYEILQIFLSKWKFLLILALCCILIAVVRHKRFPTYPAQGKLLIKTSENSQLRSFLDTIVGSQQNINPAERAIILLETNDFFLELADHFKTNKQEDSEISNYINSFKDNNQGLASNLRSKLKFRLNKGGQIFFNVNSNRRILSTTIVNQGLIVAKNYLTVREMKEYNEAELYFQSEIDHTLNNLNDLKHSSIQKMQQRNVISLNEEKGEGTKYLSGLKKQINDSQIKISENNSTIKKLKKKERTDSKNQSKFGVKARIMQLNDENSALRIKISTSKRYLKKISNQKLELVPFEQEMEKIKANYHFEFKIYEGLRDKLAKIGLQKTYIQNKIDILEFERLDRVRSRPGILLLILIAIMISQVVGFTLIYLIELFKPIKTQSQV
ncbi:hypothetical protein [Halobacteriovorax sp. JY17]|uniref:hypothetical protein n=1 Tax=Halobacteriovorax sp. JY17 TaxID=2014617 RepID=UPI0025C2CF83|nr:hypothetical protein [Halobacteriovorax sp. JY17]